MSRVLEPEWMDDPDIDPALHERALRDLDRINRLSWTARGLARAILRLPGAERVRRVVDVGCGGGGVTAELATRLAARLPDVEVVGVDASPACVATATRLHGRRAPVRFVVGRVGEGAPPLPATDVLVSSLFLHHLDDGNVAALLRALPEIATVGAVFDDLRRHRGAWSLTWLGTRLVSGCPVVHTDGPRSVRAAFTCAELAERAADAGLERVVVRPRWPMRLRLTWVAA